MFKKSLVLVLTLIFIFSAFGILNAEEVKNPDTFTYATSGNIPTLDPSFAYDSAAIAAMSQVYETLIEYDGESVTDFKPMLAKEVPSEENDLIREDGTVYEFPIREDVEFSNGNELTPEDVKYSFMRTLIQDRAGGPVWMLYEPLFGTGSLSEVTEELVGVEDPKELSADESTEIYNAIEEKIEVDGNSVIFNLEQPYPPFLAILAHSSAWSSIMNKEWSVEQGAWDGSADNIAEYHDPNREDDPLYDKMMGTGPFVMDVWEKGDYISYERNDNYWREPANFENAEIKMVDEFSTRQMMLERGDADMIYVDMQYMSQIEGMDGVRIEQGHPTLNNTVGIMNWDIQTDGNEAVGSGELDGEGIPSDFFADKDVRKGFSYAFNYDAFIDEVRRGNAKKARGPIVDPLLGFDEDSEAYEHNLEKAEEHFREAFDGELWENGFEMTIHYNSGNDVRKVASDMLKEYIESLNPDFDIEIRGVQWATYLDNLTQGNFTLGFMGWHADYPDAHNFVQPYLASDGTFGQDKGENFTEWAEENTDSLIDDGIATTDEEEREEIYTELQNLGFEEATDLWVDQPLGNVVMRDWVEGWYSNPVHPDILFYNLDK
ncbi:MAG: ABC transporter substrate-binding protein [Bacillota bacterium]